MQSGVPLIVSGGNSSLLTARTNDKAETTSEAARVTWLFLAGVGSSSRRKNGLRLRTTGLSKFKYESYPVMISIYFLCRIFMTYKIARYNLSFQLHTFSVSPATLGPRISRTLRLLVEFRHAPWAFGEASRRQGI
jgi:hypothetical protein